MKSRGPKILLVDDEPNVLQGLMRSLRGSFEVLTASSGAEGLTVLGDHRDVAVIMSDMRMPLMNGAAFLAKACLIAPDAVRLLLTGQADMEDAIAAINDGHIFRFLKKPCPPDVVHVAFAAALAQHRLVTAERTLLEQTLRGSIQALTDTLALANPGVFGIATRVKRCSSAIATKLGLGDIWQTEVAAMVCQLGAMTLPAGVFERRARSEGLLEEERAMLDRVPAVTEQLLASIPRLEAVRGIIRHSRATYLAPDPSGGALRVRREVPIGARILKAALDFDELTVVGYSPQRALERMRERVGAYDPDVVRALESLHEKEACVVELATTALREGMILAQDVMMKNGVLLIARGHPITPGLLMRLENFASSLASTTVTVESTAS